MLMTGRHVVADITCSSCGSVLGWKYEKAYELSQKVRSPSLPSSCHSIFASLTITVTMATSWCSIKRGSSSWRRPRSFGRADGDCGWKETECVTRSDYDYD